MATRACVFALVFLLGSLGSRDFIPELVIWNVGQGQWLTFVDVEACWHIDMGGEFAPWNKIIPLCRSRANRISLSHWDSDHINFITAARAQLPNLCLVNRPAGQGSARKEDMLHAIPECSGSSPFSQWVDKNGKSANSKSWVVSWRGILAPGDSPRSEEKKWVPQLAGLAQTKVLILGHHGSRTSTSELLLNSLPKVRMAIASQRRRRYGHPHSDVVRALFQHHIPLLLTEEWGSIHIRL